MASMDLRPLSLGELLDRTFTLYRRHFVLFLGISAIPYLLVLALNLLNLFLTTPAVSPQQPALEEQFQTSTAAGTGGLVLAGLIGIAVIIATLIAVLLSQGATVFAISEIYLGRSTSIGESFRRMRGELGSLFGVIFLNGLATLVGFICLIIPGIYVACRLAVAVPAALLEDLGARDSLERSWGLTKDNVGRILLIFVLYVVLWIASRMLFVFPVGIAIAAAGKEASMLRMWTAFLQVGLIAAQVLVAPVLTIATSLLYYDLRVRKEAFDLQMLMKPLGGPGSSSAGVPHTLA